MSEYYYTDAQRQPQGPVSFESLRAMALRGELPSGCLVAEVGADHWQDASVVLGGTAPPVNPTAPIGVDADRFEPLAGWSFGLGIAAWTLCLSIFAAIPAIILGHLALGRIKASRSTNSVAKALAIIGLVAGYVHLLLIAAYALFMVIVFVAAAAGAAGSGP
ncbi:MAG: DUF4190 domain-containing protein [Phycisphaeraceae bacterium]|nr:DUF4190 domain-containing protein [Phycisphaeraceae bacterium]